MRPKSRGQAIAEMAIAFPIILFTMLGALEAGMLLSTKVEQDRHTQTLADWFVAHPGQTDAPELLMDCTLEGELQTDLLKLTSRCHYTPHLTNGLGWDGLEIVSTEYTALPPDAILPSPTP